MSDTGRGGADGTTSGVGYSEGCGLYEGQTSAGRFSGGNLSGYNTVDSLVYEGDPPPLP